MPTKRHHMHLYFLVFTLVLQVSTAIALHGIDRPVASPGVLTILGALQFLNMLAYILVTVWLCRGIMRQTVILSEGWTCYTSSIFSFAGFYTICHFAIADAFQAEGKEWGVKASIPDVIFATIYFSTMTQTCTGLGDITPRHPLTQAAANIQMMGGVFYSAVIISQTLERLTEGSHHRPHLVETQPRAMARWWEAFARARKFGRKYLGLISLFLQLFSYGVQYNSTSGTAPFCFGGWRALNQQRALSPRPVLFATMCFNRHHLRRTVTNYVRR